MTKFSFGCDICSNICCLVSATAFGFWQAKQPNAVLTVFLEMSNLRTANEHLLIEIIYISNYCTTINNSSQFYCCSFFQYCVFFFLSNIDILDTIKKVQSPGLFYTGKFYQHDEHCMCNGHEKNSYKQQIAGLFTVFLGLGYLGL